MSVRTTIHQCKRKTECGPQGERTSRHIGQFSAKFLAAHQGRKIIYPEVDQVKWSKRRNLKKSACRDLTQD